MTAIRTAVVPAARAKSDVLGRLTSALLLATLAVDALFFVGLLASGGDINPLVNVWLAVATQWIPVAVFWLVAARTGFSRVPVILAAAAVTFTAAGDAYYSLAMDADGYLPFPSPADAGYLLFYPLMVAALVMLVRRQLAGVGGLVLLETAVATVGASAVLAFALDPVIDSALASGTALDSTIALSYPLFDVVLLAVIAGIAAAPTVTLGARSWALITGLGLFAVADVVYALMENHGAYIAGTPLDATWAMGLGFITWWGAGVVLPTGEPAITTATVAKRVVIPLPSVAVLAGLTVLILGTQVTVSELTVVLAGATVGLGAVPIIFRQAMLGRMLAAQQEAVRRLTELDQAKTDILVTVNHEFRTPLTSITGHVELLIDGDAGEIPEPAVGMLRTIERNAERLQRLIDDTFTAVHFEGEKELVEHSPIGVNDLVARAVAAVAAFATRRDVEIVVDSRATALTVEGARAHLERGLIILLDNAVKFSAAGRQVRVTVEGARDGREVVIRIDDEGIGIPTADIPRLFTRFFRASNVQDAAIPGIGLGLSIAQQVVRAHGGSIAVESELDRGTTMTVRLPASPS